MDSDSGTVLFEVDADVEVREMLVDNLDDIYRKDLTVVDEGMPHGLARRGAGPEVTLAQAVNLRRVNEALPSFIKFCDIGCAMYRHERIVKASKASSRPLRVSLRVSSSTRLSARLVVLRLRRRPPSQMATASAERSRFRHGVEGGVGNAPARFPVASFSAAAAVPRRMGEPNPPPPSPPSPPNPPNPSEAFAPSDAWLRRGSMPGPERSSRLVAGSAPRAARAAAHGPDGDGGARERKRAGEREGGPHEPVRPGGRRGAGGRSCVQAPGTPSLAAKLRLGVVVVAALRGGRS